MCTHILKLFSFLIVLLILINKAKSHTLNTYIYYLDQHFINLFIVILIVLIN